MLHIAFSGSVVMFVVGAEWRAVLDLLLEVINDLTVRDKRWHFLQIWVLLVHHKRRRDLLPVLIVHHLLLLLLIELLMSVVLIAQAAAMLVQESTCDGWTPWDAQRSHLETNAALFDVLFEGPQTRPRDKLLL